MIRSPRKSIINSSASSPASTSRASTRTSPTPSPTPTLLLTTPDRDRAIAAVEAKIRGRRGRARPAGRAAPAGVRGLARVAEAQPRAGHDRPDRRLPARGHRGRQGRQPGRSQEARPDVGEPRGGRGAGGPGAAAQRREQRDAPPGQLRPLRAVLAGAVDQDAGFQGPRGDRPPLDGLDRRRQPGLSAPDRGRQAERRPDPLLAGQRDRHPGQRAGADQPVDPRRDRLRRLEPGRGPGALRRRPHAPIARSSATSSPRTSPAAATTTSPSASGSATADSRTAWSTRSRSSTAR